MTVEIVATVAGDNMRRHLDWNPQASAFKHEIGAGLMAVAEHERIVAAKDAEIFDVSAERNAMQAQRDRARDGLARECDDADYLIRLIGLDPESCRTEGGSINIGKISAALTAQPSGVVDEREAFEADLHATLESMGITPNTVGGKRLIACCAAAVKRFRTSPPDNSDQVREVLAKLFDTVEWAANDTGNLLIDSELREEVRAALAAYKAQGGDV